MALDKIRVDEDQLKGVALSKAEKKRLRRQEKKLKKFGIRDESKMNKVEKFFYNIPLLSISYGGLVAMLIVGSVFMAIPVLPEWIGIIVCVIILAFNAIAIIKATAAADIVSEIDEKIKTQTFFIKSLSVDAQSLMTSAKSDELREEAKKVYEAIHYSDPMANAALSDLDAQIERQFNSFSDAIKADDAELAKERRLQDALLSIKKQFGKNAVLKAMSLQEGATAKDRNQQVGGHKA